MQESNVELLCNGVDLIFDAFDVTTPAGIRAKIALHCKAKKRGLPVLSALDLGLRQWGMSFDYCDPNLEVFNRKKNDAIRSIHPIKALFEMYPLNSVPDQCIQMVLDLIDGNTTFASQLGCTSDILSGIIVPVVLRLVETGQLVKKWDIELNQYRSPPRENWSKKYNYWQLRRSLKLKLAQLTKIIGEYEPARPRISIQILIELLAALIYVKLTTMAHQNTFEISTGVKTFRILFAAIELRCFTKSDGCPILNVRHIA